MLKKKFFSLAIAGALAFCGYTGFAFDMQQDILEYTKDPTVMVTLYLGMPMSEEEANFAGATQWTKKEHTNSNSTFESHSYSRTEPSEYKGINKHEAIEADYYDGDNLKSVVVSVSYRIDGEKNGLDDKVDGLSKKDVKKLNNNLWAIGNELYNQTVKTLGQPTKIQHPANADIKYITFSGVTWGKRHGDDGLLYTWRLPGEEYTLDIITYYNGTGHVYLEHKQK